MAPSASTSGHLHTVPVHEMPRRATPSSITPVPSDLPAQDPIRVTGSARSTAIAGLGLGVVTTLAGMIQAVGGLPEVVKALLAILAHGWPGAIVLLAISMFLMHLQGLATVRAEARADRAAQEARQAERDGQVIRAVNETARVASALLEHAKSEDMAHQRAEARNLELVTILAKLEATLSGEPTSPSRLYPSGGGAPSASTLPPVPPRSSSKL